MHKNGKNSSQIMNHSKSNCHVYGHFIDILNLPPPQRGAYQLQYQLQDRRNSSQVACPKLQSRIMSGENKTSEELDLYKSCTSH